MKGNVTSLGMHAMLVPRGQHVILDEGDHRSGHVWGGRKCWQASHTLLRPRPALCPQNPCQATDREAQGALLGSSLPSAGTSTPMCLVPVPTLTQPMQRQTRPGRSRPLPVSASPGRPGCSQHPGYLAPRVAAQTLEDERVLRERLADPNPVAHAHLQKDTKARTNDG